MTAPSPVHQNGHSGGRDPRAVAETVTDPELPMLTLADLGVLRDVRVERGTVVVDITPTYSGCPAMGVMRADLVHALHRAGSGPPVGQRRARGPVRRVRVGRRPPSLEPSGRPAG